MALKDLKPGQGKVDVTAQVIEKGETREFQKFGKPGRVASATIKDESGQLTLTLWNEQIEQVEVGDKIRISNGYVSEWQGIPQLSTGKFGTLEVMEKGKGAPEKKPSVSAPSPHKKAPGEEIIGDEEIIEEEIEDGDEDPYEK